MMSALARGLKSLCLLFCFLATAQPVHAQDPNADIYGTWKIIEMTGGADFISKSDAEARALVGKSFYVSPERFTFNGKTCPYPEYKRNTEETRWHFIADWGADSSDLHLPNPVTFVDTGFATGCYLLYLQRKNRVIIAVDSVFYTAVRTRKPKPR
jgi:hypothetical protein